MWCQRVTVFPFFDLFDFLLLTPYKSNSPRKMPVPTPLNQVYALFPTVTREQIDAARTSAWYDTFADITFPAKFIDLKELGEEEEFLRVSTGPRVYSVGQYVDQ